MKLLITFFIFLLPLLALYPVASLLAGQWNPLLWQEPSKFIFVFTWLNIAFGGIIKMLNERG